ncbi:tetratricopeptide repeat protein [Dongia soli]|uniref:Tetratricopeptide repeat protein n=1 Tax=Dongia soli TaxID=600628 RepID=A0ABU5EBY2_9PROT|nr:tetratricopeptide repeat protein [Dongia soli]MDY0883299.1 tetratricopeptide repeat protein [Dongia soli]
MILSISILLAGCSTVKSFTSQDIADSAPIADAAKEPAVPNLDVTLRQAAADAEAGYKYSEAANHYTTLLQRYPDDETILLALARNFRFAGSPQQAIQVVNARITKVGVKPPLLVELGKDYLAADQLNLAIPALNQAKGLTRDDWGIYSALGVAYDYQGQYALAQEAYQAGLKLAPANSDLLNNYALSLAQSGQLDMAISTLQQAVNQPSASPQMRQNLALLLAFKGDKDGATRLIRMDLPDDMARNNINYYQGLGSN